jgi:hypothetical protein
MKNEKNDKQMTGTNDRTKKNDRSKWQKNDHANDKIVIFMYPSVWLQVPSNAKVKQNDDGSAWLFFTSNTKGSSG